MLSKRSGYPMVRLRSAQHSELSRPSWITEFEPGHRVVLRGENSTVLSVDVITVDASGDGAVLTYDADLTLKGPLRLLDPLLGLAFGRIADRALAGLTEWLKS